MFQFQTLDRMLEAFAVFCTVDSVGLVPITGTPAASSARASFSGV
ncbi:hypothetical protein ACLK17_00260 [Escherichia coli]